MFPLCFCRSDSDAVPVLDAAAADAEAELLRTPSVTKKRKATYGAPTGGEEIAVRTSAAGVTEPLHKGKISFAQLKRADSMMTKFNIEGAKSDSEEEDSDALSDESHDVFGEEVSADEISRALSNLSALGGFGGSLGGGN